jgi:hypothetical protein
MTTRCLSVKGNFKYLNNRTTHNRHLYRKTAFLSYHRCLINTGIEKAVEYRLDFLTKGVWEQGNFDIRTIEQEIIDTYAGKPFSKAATSV